MTNCCATNRAEILAGQTLARVSQLDRHRMDILRDIGDWSPCPFNSLDPDERGAELTAHIRELWHNPLDPLPGWLGAPESIPIYNWPQPQTQISITQ